MNVKKGDKVYVVEIFFKRIVAKDETGKKYTWHYISDVGKILSGTAKANIYPPICQSKKLISQYGISRLRWSPERPSRDLYGHQFASRKEAERWRKKQIQLKKISNKIPSKKHNRWWWEIKPNIVQTLVDIARLTVQKKPGWRWEASYSGIMFISPCGDYAIYLVTYKGVQKDSWFKRDAEFFIGSAGKKILSQLPVKVQAKIDEFDQKS